MENGKRMNYVYDPEEDIITLKSTKFHWFKKSEVIVHKVYDLSSLVVKDKKASKKKKVVKSKK